jgi:hypothetical protein
MDKREAAFRDRNDSPLNVRATALSTPLRATRQHSLRAFAGRGLREAGPHVVAVDIDAICPAERCLLAPDLGLGLFGSGHLVRRAMSTLPPKADMCGATRDVC